MANTDSAATNPSCTKPAAGKAAKIIGWVLAVLPSLMLLFSGVMKLAKPPGLAEGFAHLGWPDRLALHLGIVEIVSTLIYLFPKTAVLGAVLLTGYLGGAMATHIRLGEPWYAQFGLGVVIWFSLFLRDVRLRQLLPFRC